MRRTHAARATHQHTALRSSVRHLPRREKVRRLLELLEWRGVPLPVQPRTGLRPRSQGVHVGRPGARMQKWRYQSRQSRTRVLGRELGRELRASRKFIGEILRRSERAKVVFTDTACCRYFCLNHNSTSCRVIIALIEISISSRIFSTLDRRKRDGRRESWINYGISLSYSTGILIRALTLRLS